MIVSRTGWIGRTFILSLALLAQARAGEEIEIRLRIEPPVGGIVLGRPFQLVLEARGDRRAAPPFPDRPDLGSDLRVMGSLAGDPGAGGAPRRTYQVLALRSGTLEVPSLVWAVDTDRICRSNRAEIQVLSPIPEGEHPPARPDLLMSIPGEGMNPLWILVPVLLLAGGALTGFILLRRRGAVSTPAPPEPPHLAALRALDRLGGAAPGSPEEWDAFYVSLSRILRGYSGGRFRVDALERTTAELDAVLEEAGKLAGDARRLLRDLLREADLVKFRPKKSGNGASRDALARARRFIESTALESAEIPDGCAGGRP